MEPCTDVATASSGGEAAALLFRAMEYGLPVSLADVRVAAEVIAGHVMRTPFAPSKTLSAIAGTQLSVKFENLQFTASFKERGARNRLHHLSASERTRGVVAASAGNHAQGVAHHAQLLGIAATIVMPRSTPSNKVNRTRVLGATVELHGDSFEAAAQRAGELSALHGLTLVHPFADPMVIAGQGTVALEMLEDDPTLDTLVVPIGGGGLIAGVAVAAKALRPSIRIVGVQSELYPWAAARAPIAHGAPPSVAEGIAVKGSHPLTQLFIDELVDEVIVVTEDSIEEAVCLFLDVEKVVAEGAGAAPLAALIAHPGRFSGQRCGLVLSGGNVDLRLLARMAMRGIARSGRLVRLAIDLNDQIGALSNVLLAIAHHDGNVVEVHHTRNKAQMSSRRARVEIEVELTSGDELPSLIAELQRSGFDVVEQT